MDDQRVHSSDIWFNLQLDVRDVGAVLATGPS